MAEHTVMLELEQASHLFMAPPDLITREQRQAAQDVILNFRKTRMPYGLCQYILENSKNDYTLFQAATTIKEAIVRDWTLMGPDAVESLRSFLLRYITNHITLQSYVREQILQTVAVILKRATLDKKGKSCDGLFEDVTALISSGNITMQLVACSMLTSLLNEYSYTSRTSSVGLTWEFHIKCKRAFEQSDLKRVFMFTLQVLNEIEAQPSPLSREATAFLNRILSIAEQVLNWEFTPRGVRMHHAFVSNPNATLKPPESWSDVLLEKNTLSLFFRIHMKARFNSEMAHHSIQCLVQLASLNGLIFTKETQPQYLAQFIEGFLQMLSQIDLQEYENFSVASIFKNLLLMFPIQNFNSLDVVLFKSFVQTLTALTCSMSQLAAQEESMHKDDRIHMESYEKLLESWSCLTREVSSLPPETLISPATQIFNSYLQCHLAPPDGVRSMNADESEEDIGETEEDDREKFSDQLCCIGALGRIIPAHTVPLLAKLLEDRVSQISNHLHRYQQQRDMVSSHETTVDLSGLHSLQEDLHWLILVTGNLLADAADGETATIPSTIMKYSMDQAKTTDINLTLKMFSSPGQKLEPSHEQNVDPVIRLITAVFRLCEVENRAVDAKLNEFLSPQVGSTIMWFLERWADAYVLHDEMDYTEMSLMLATAFGMDTEGVKWTVNFILQKIFSTLSVWGSEPALISDTLELLIDMAEQSSRAMYLTQTDVLWNLAKLESNQQPPVATLPPDGRRQFMKAMVLAGCGIKDSAQEEHYWKLLLQSNRERFLVLVESPDFKVGKETSRQQFLYLLETLIGVATATQNSIAKEMYQFMAPLLAHIIKAIDLLHNYEDVVTTSFELFSEVVARMLPFLNSQDSQTLYQLSLSAIQMFARHNLGRQCISAEDEQETKFKDIILIMEMLTNLMSKDLLGFNKEEQANKENPGIDGATVVIYGLELIVPLMSAEMLKFPVLCSCYFRLISFLSDLHSDKFCQLPEPLFNNIMASVELGFNSSTSDVMRMLFESLLAIATHSFQNSQTTQHLQATLGHFLKVVFQLLVLENFDLSLQEVGSTTLFCLICCNQDLYRDLVNQLIQVQPEEYKQRLLQAFNELTPQSLQLSITRQNKITFRANFDMFLNNVRGFLCVR
ncbi:exportin-4-like isoform X2 [Physella acuta]|uniref:exportin-4-like isoform X2 n=1 Tax=Physella acuta TaxID=109671 RepID=UPI0027DE4B37|nr:exportin-4-like isoform X2 [Physella acuta]